MKKKNKITKKQNESTKSKVLHVVAKLKQKVLTHGVLIMFTIAGGSIGYALYRSKGYLNPGRDEAKYQELSSSLNYSKIDYKLVEKLQEALNDTDVTVTQNLAPNRSNPFSE